MVSIVCDTCGAEARPNTEKSTGKSSWIQGYDLITSTPRMMQHAIRFLDRWDDRRIAEYGAVHFCGAACKDKYLAKNKVA
jgi:hypothetical protein